jgi:hypothetical protein
MNREGLDPIMYNGTLDYLEIVTYMRSLYGRNKVEVIQTEKDLKEAQSKHPHHIVMGVFKRMYSRPLQEKFEALAKQYPTLKFVDYKDVDGFYKSHIQGNHQWESLFEGSNGTLVILRKEELVRRSVKAIEVYNPE